MNRNKPVTFRVLVVGNYPADRQQSMDRFAAMLVKLYRQDFTAHLACPAVLITRIPFLPTIAKKYLAYIDKLIIFPCRLYLVSRKYNLVHIADHGNAYYAFCCKPGSCIITCHDLLAVRGANGDLQAACSASPLGPWLQKLIMAGLQYSRRLTFVSNATFLDYMSLAKFNTVQKHKIISNCLNAVFTKDANSINITPQDCANIPKDPYLLMVGSSLFRKNRLLAFQLIAYLGKSSPYQLVLAGAPITRSEQDFLIKNDLYHRLVSLVFPSHSLLNLLYCKAHALLFPSLSEGFGWPLIEAQACGCPVIASNTTSIPEVVGSGGLLSDPYDVETFASHVYSLENPEFRNKMINKGYSNIERFDRKNIADSYIKFAKQL